MTDSAVYLYPWDVTGDPDAARRVAGTGAREVALAAIYHDVRAITPFHPGHRIVTKRAGALYGPEADESFERAAGALREAGLTVTAWVVVTHNETMAAGRPDLAVRNAFGDVYPWALCCASPGTREYATSAAAEVAALDCVDGVELEACGWFGFDHQSPHDKTGGIGGWPLDLCWCDFCAAAFAAAGLDVVKACARVREAIDAGVAGPRDEPASARAAGAVPGALSAGEVAAARSAGALPAELAATLAEVRTRLAGEFLRAVVAAARSAGKPVLVQVDPDPLAAGANPGFAPEDLAVADRLVVNCSSGDLTPVTRLAASRPAVTLAATGPARDGLTQRARSARAAGASGLRFYHAGLARRDDLTAIHEAIEQALSRVKVGIYCQL